MKKTAQIMGMRVAVEIIDGNGNEEDITEVFRYLQEIDEIFSTYKQTSEIGRINRGEVKIENASEKVKEIFALCEQTKKETNGYFDMSQNGKIDPSGIVKGCAIFQSAELLARKKYRNFYIEISGDIEVRGLNSKNEKWKIGIENPFNREEIVKVVSLSNNGIATSGTAKRSNHIYNPLTGNVADGIASISVIGPNVYEADRFATAAFAMGEKGIEFIEKLSGFEGYMITKEKKAIYTSQFEKYLLE